MKHLILDLFEPLAVWAGRLCYICIGLLIILTISAWILQLPVLSAGLRIQLVLFIWGITAILLLSEVVIAWRDRARKKRLELRLTDLDLDLDEREHLLHPIVRLISVGMVQPKQPS